MTVKLLNEHHLEHLSLKGGVPGSAESTHVKIPHCWKSQDAAQLFLDKNTVPHLYQLLERMQGLESESHLCIQNYVGGETCQQNLVVEGASLVVQHEVRKKKPARDSSLHLRVNTKKT